MSRPGSTCRQPYVKRREKEGAASYKHAENPYHRQWNLNIYISAVTLRECHLDLRVCASGLDLCVRALCRRCATRVQLTCACKISAERKQAVRRK